MRTLQELCLFQFSEQNSTFLPPVGLMIARINSTPQQIKFIHTDYFVARIEILIHATLHILLQIVSTCHG